MIMLKIRCNRRQTSSGHTYFILEHVEEYVAHEALLKQFLIASFDGLNEKKTDAILAYTGPDIFTFAASEDAAIQLKEHVKGVVKIADTLIEKLRATVVIRDIMQLIEPYGGTYEHALRLFERHGNNAFHALCSSVYTEGAYAGMDIFLCDRISNAAYYDKTRVSAFLFDAMERALSMGHSCLPYEKMIQMAQTASSNSCYEEKVPYSCFLSALITHINEKKFLVYRGKDTLYVYQPKLAKAEDTVVEQVKRLQLSSYNTKWDSRNLPAIEEYLSVTYNDGQKQAFSLLEKTGIKILTGPPGSGKTMTIRGLIHAYECMNPDKKIALCASTGRAAQVMSRASGKKSQTMYKLLDIRPYGDWEIQSKNENDPIDADFIICDEVSMSGLMIMSLLFRAVKSGALLLLVGDEDQLQSVDLGNVLYDLIHSGQIEVYRLQEVMRQQNGQIYSNAVKAKNGRVDFVEDNTFRIYHFASETQIMDYLKQNYKKAGIQDHLSKQIIMLTRVGVCGTKTVNKIFELPQKNAILYGGYAYHLHDKIIMNRTNYRKGYFNGDIGYICHLNTDSITVKINEWEIPLSHDDLSDIEPAEAVTAHKAQGSEFDYVYFIVSPQYRNMLTKRILYTTMTRAKKKLLVLTCGHALTDSRLVGNEDIRYSNLAQKLQKSCSSSCKNACKE